MSDVIIATDDLLPPLKREGRGELLEDSGNSPNPSFQEGKGEVGRIVNSSVVSWDPYD